jgi:flagellar hook assembly protein FlgD
MSAISGAGTTSTPRSSSDAFSQLSSEEFLKVIFKELANQDPLAPNDTKEILQQISTIRSIESDISLSKRLDQMVKQNEISSSSAMVGKFIKGRSDGGARVGGFVNSVNVTTDGVLLNLGNNIRVPLKNVEEIVDPELVQPAPPQGTTTTGG